MKAQTSQIFVYALTAIAVGLVLLLGYKFIGKSLQQGCDVQLVKFHESLEKEANGITHGSVRTIDLSTACDYSEICFVDNDMIGNSAFTMPEYSVIESSVREGVRTSVFLVDEGRVEPLLENDRIQIADSAGYSCMSAQGGRFSIRIEGAGQNVLVG